MDIPNFLICSLINGHLGCFYLSASVNSATLQCTNEQHSCASICVSTCFQFFGYLPRSGIAGSYGNSMSNLLRTRQAGFHSSCAISHSHQQCMKAPISHMLTSTCYLLFFDYCHPSGCENGISLWF